MRPAAQALGLAAAVALALGLGAADGRSAPAARALAGARAAAAVARLQVTQVDYRLLLSTATVRAGRLNLEEIDGGKNPHDLRLRRSGSSATIYGRLLTPGRRWSGVVSVQAGSYTLWCSLPEHAKLGMHSALRVIP